LRDNKPARKVVKRSRWLLLRNAEHLKGGQAVQVQELLAANQPLATVYLLKDALKEVWYPRASGKAGNAGGPGYGRPEKAAWHRYTAASSPALVFPCIPACWRA